KRPLPVASSQWPANPKRQLSAAFGQFPARPTCSSHRKSLFLKILPVNHAGSIFCREFPPKAMILKNYGGEGVSHYPGVSGSSAPRRGYIVLYCLSSNILQHERDSQPSCRRSASS